VCRPFWRPLIAQLCWCASRLVWAMVVFGGAVGTFLRARLPDLTSGGLSSQSYRLTDTKHIVRGGAAPDQANLAGDEGLGLPNGLQGVL